MKPSKEAIEAGLDFIDRSDTPKEWLEGAIAAAYAIDVAPLEQRIKELEKEKLERINRATERRE
jgi:hypothetical protein